MTLKELCSQFMHDATLKIIDATSFGKDITDIVRKNKNLFQDVEVEDIDIRGGYIVIIISSGELASKIKAIEAYMVLKDYCKSKPTNNECETCIFRDDDDYCILANNTPENWDNI